MKQDFTAATLKSRSQLRGEMNFTFFVSALGKCSLGEVTSTWQKGPIFMFQNRRRDKCERSAAGTGAAGWVNTTSNHMRLDTET